MAESLPLIGSSCVILLRPRGLTAQEGAPLEVLLHLRERTPTLRGSWATAGGKMEDSETAEACALRELREEAGLDVLQMQDPVRRARMADTVGLGVQLARPRAFRFLRAVVGPSDIGLFLCHLFVLRLLPGEAPQHTEAAHGPWQAFTPREALELPLLSGVRAGLELLRARGEL